jgi:hypothetical protein
MYKTDLPYDGYGKDEGLRIAATLLNKHSTYIHKACCEVNQDADVQWATKDAKVEPKNVVPYFKGYRPRFYFRTTDLEDAITREALDMYKLSTTIRY